MATRYGRIKSTAGLSGDGSPLTRHIRNGVVFKKHDWTTFDSALEGPIVADPKLEVVSSLPTVVADDQSTRDELRAAAIAGGVT